MDWLTDNLVGVAIVLAVIGAISAAGFAAGAAAFDAWIARRNAAEPNRTCRDCDETYARILGECPGCAKGRV